MKFNSLVLAAVFCPILVSSSFADTLYATIGSSVVKIDESGNIVRSDTVNVNGLAFGVAVDHSGNVYVATGVGNDGSGVNGIQRIDPAGNVSIFDNGSDTGPVFTLALGMSENLYFVANDKIGIDFLPDGSRVAESTEGVIGNPLTSDGLGNVYGLGRVPGHIEIRKFGPSCKATVLAKISTFGGYIAATRDGHVYFWDSGIKIADQKGNISVFDSTSPGANAMAFDSAGNLFVYREQTSEIRKYPAGSNVSSHFMTILLQGMAFAPPPRDSSVVALANDAATDVGHLKFASFGSPAINQNNHSAFQATVAGMAGTEGVTTSNNSGIWADNSSGVRHLVARTGDYAPGTSNAIFAKLGDPVYNNAEEAAFRGTLVPGIAGVVKTPVANNLGIWSNGGGVLHLVARLGDQAPGCPVGAAFSGFQQMLISDDGRVVVLGALRTGTAAAPVPGGTVSTNNLGIWAEDLAGNLQLLVRKGDVHPVTSQIITALNFMPTIAGTSGQTRSVNQATGDLMYRANFSVGSGIFKIVFP